MALGSRRSKDLGLCPASRSTVLSLGAFRSGSGQNGVDAMTVQVLRFPSSEAGGRYRGLSSHRGVEEMHAPAPTVLDRQLRPDCARRRPADRRLRRWHGIGSTSSAHPQPRVQEGLHVRTTRTAQAPTARTACHSYSPLQPTDGKCVRRMDSVRRAIIPPLSRMQRAQRAPRRCRCECARH